MKNRKDGSDAIGGLIGEKNVRYLPYALFIIALLVRLYYMPAGLLHTDSVIAVQEAERTVWTGRLHYLQGILGYPGFAAMNSILFLIYHALSGATSAEGFLLFSSAFFGAASVALTYILALRLTNSRMAAVYSALILCFMPLHLTMSTYVKDQVLGSCALLLTSLIALRSGGEGKAKTRILAGAFLGYAMAIRQQEILFLPTLLILYYLDCSPFAIKKVKGRIKFQVNESPFKVLSDMVIIVAVAAIVFVAFYIPKMMDEPGFNLVNSIFASSAESSAGFGIYSAQMPYSLQWALMTLTYLGVAILAGSILVNYNRDKSVLLTLTFWMASYFLFYGNIVGASPYFFFQALVPAAIIMGWGLEYGYGRFRDIAYIVLVVLIIWMLVTINPLLTARKEYCGPCAFSKKMAESIPQTSYVIGIDETRHYEYYANITRNLGHYDPTNAQEMVKYGKMLHEIMQNGTGVYVTTQGFSYDFLPPEALVYDSQKQELANRVTSKAYKNLLFDGQRLYDRQSGSPVPPVGLWGLEMFNDYKVTEVYSMRSEDWHHKDLESGAFNSVLYRIEERQVQPKNGTS
jgi:hypothetical protein